MGYGIERGIWKRTHLQGDIQDDNKRQKRFRSLIELPLQLNSRSFRRKLYSEQ